MIFKSATVKENADNIPLKKGKINFDAVNLIIGDNEEGKTTLVDILIQSIFPNPKNRNTFVKSIWNNRFKFDDIVEVDKESISFTDPLLNISSLLVIRNGETRWLSRSDKNIIDIDFWNSDVKEIIYGNDGIYSKTQKKLKTALGVSTSRGWFIKLNEYLNALLETVNFELQKIEEMKSDRKKIAEYKNEVKIIQSQLDEQTNARQLYSAQRKKEAGEKYFEWIDRLKSMKNEIDIYEKRNILKTSKDWQSLIIDKNEAEKSIISANQAVDFKNTSARESQKELEELIEERKKKSMEKAAIENKQEVFMEKKAMREKDFKTRADNIALESKGDRKFKGLFIAALVQLIAGILVGAFGALNFYNAIKLDFSFLPLLPLILFITGGSILFIGLIILIVGLVLNNPNKTNIIYEKKRMELEKDFDNFKYETKMTIERDNEAITSLNKDIDKYNAKILERGDKNKRLKKEILELEESLKDAKGLFNSLNDKEIEFKKIYFSYEQTLKEGEKFALLKTQYAKLITEKNELEKKVGSAFSTLNETRINEEIRELTNFIRGNSGLDDKEYNEERYNSLVERKDILAEDISILSANNEKIKVEALTAIENELLSINAKVSSDYLKRFYGDISLLSLNGDAFNIFGLHKKISELIDNVKIDIHLSQLVSEANDNLNSRVESVIEEALYTDNFRRAFAKLPNGNYSGVEFEVNKSRIGFFLKNRNGGIFQFDNMSAGVTNQFYIAVRLALALDIFGTEKGTFIFDDAFITFDEKRRKSSIELLKEYAEMGWQIIYASVNETGMERLFDEVFDKNLNKIVL